jgi:hypothetical protein
MAPFSALYYFPNTSADVSIYHPEVTKLNPYRGSALCVFVRVFTLGELTDWTDWYILLMFYNSANKPSPA